MQYKDVDKPEVMRGIKRWENPKNGFTVVMTHYTADPDKDPARNGSEWHKKEKKGAPKAVWLKEYEIDFTTKSGKLIYGADFCDFNKDVHFIDSYELDSNVKYVLGLDFGQSNPTCALVGAWTLDGKLIIIDEYYKAALPSVSSKEMFDQFSYIIGDTTGKSIAEKRRMMQNTFATAVIDPTTRSKNRSKKSEGEEIQYSVIEEFYDNGWDFMPGNNDVAAGINRMREYFQLDEDGQAGIYVFKDKCPNFCWELQRYRYKEIGPDQMKFRNNSEEPVKKDDHAVDAGRYLVMEYPRLPKEETKPKTVIQKDIEKLLRPRISVDSWDVD